jgi:hypothetical protein
LGWTSPESGELGNGERHGYVGGGS